MRTVIWKPILAGLVLGAGFLAAGSASADVTSDRPAAILVWPKLLFSSPSDNVLSPAGTTVDTTIQVTNTSDQEARLRCFYVNANAHCSNDPTQVCGANADCQSAGPGGLCRPGWIEIDFEITLTPNQPLVWNLGNGLANLPCAAGGCGSGGSDSRNIGSIPPANEDPFMGELKCILVGENNEPIDRNWVKGEATIVTVDSSSVDARGYNAVGIQAIEGANDGDNTLLIGEEYNGCPSVLILDHFFEDAVVPDFNDGEEYVKTHVTLVPCSQDFELQAPFKTTVQLLVFNEFEQRFSSSRPVECFKEYELCALGTGRDRPFVDSPDNSDPNYASCQRSVFSAFVNGTLTGQTRIRGVDDGVEGRGNGLLAVAEEFYRSNEGNILDSNSTTAFNVHYVGTRDRNDVMRLP